MRLDKKKEDIPISQLNPPKSQKQSSSRDEELGFDIMEEDLGPLCSRKAQFSTINLEKDNMQGSLGKKEMGRKFQSSWLSKYKWLTCNSEKGKVFCNLCTSAIRQGLPIPTVSRQVDSYKCFVENGFLAWQKALQTFQRHEQSELHRASATAIHSRDANLSVQTMMSTGREEQMLKNRRALCKIFTSLRYLGCQGLAVRGKCEKVSNLIALLQERKLDVPELDAWLKSDEKYKWLSHDVSNEILQDFSKAVLRELAKKVKDVEYFGIILDET